MLPLTIAAGNSRDAKVQPISRRLLKRELGSDLGFFLLKAGFPRVASEPNVP